MVRIAVEQLEADYQAHYQERGKRRVLPCGRGRNAAEAIGNLVLNSEDRSDVTLRGRVQIESMPLVPPVKLAALGDED